MEAESVGRRTDKLAITTIVGRLHLRGHSLRKISFSVLVVNDFGVSRYYQLKNADITQHCHFV